MASPPATPTAAAPTALSRDRPTDALNPPPTAASMPLELRLRALEARVLGVPNSQLHAERQEDENEDQETLTRRVAAASRAVEEAVGQAPQLRSLYERCECAISSSFLFSITHVFLH